MPGKIAIITDTDASLPEALTERFGIHQVPITVHFGEEVYQTGVDIDDAMLFTRIDRDGVLPTTAAPSTGAYVKAFEEAIAGGAECILCMCVSGEVSATYQSAVAARDIVPGTEIHVVDTRSLSMGQGFMVLEAAEAVEAGCSADEALERALEVGNRTHLFAALSTLKYLAMSGRVGHLAAGMANLLDVKPILTIQDGKLDLLERVRTKSKSWARVGELVSEVVQGKQIEKMAILHVFAPEEAIAFQAQLCRQVACPEQVIFTELSAGLSVHSGAGLVGVAFVTSV
jgi:DegV family protein with EDD domain